MHQDRTAASTTPRLIVVHGYSANPGKHWFPWLAEQFPGRTRIVALPEPEQPGAEAWLRSTSEALADADANTTVVAHSLGCLTALRAIAAMPEGKQLRGVVLVAGFLSPLPALPALDDFVSGGVELDGLSARSRAWHVVLSDDDPIVPPALSRELAERLDAGLLELSGAGHFMADDGVTSIPELLPIIAGETGETGENGENGENGPTGSTGARSGRAKS